MHSPYWYNLQALRHPQFPDDTIQQFARFDLWRVNRQLSHMEQWLTMANQKRNNKPSFGAEITFVTLKLDKEQAAQFQSWQNDKKTDLELEVADFMSKGWKTSITWDMNNDCFIVASTMKTDPSPNLNVCVTSRSTLWYEALCMNVFKVMVLHKGAALPVNTGSDNWG